MYSKKTNIYIYIFKIDRIIIDPFASRETSCFKRQDVQQNWLTKTTSTGLTLVFGGPTDLRGRFFSTKSHQNPPDFAWWEICGTHKVCVYIKNKLALNNGFTPIEWQNLNYSNGFQSIVFVNNFILDDWWSNGVLMSRIPYYQGGAKLGVWTYLGHMKGSVDWT